MCYLKNLAIDEQVDFDDLFAKADESSADSSEHELNVVIPCCEKQLRAEWSEEQQMLINLFDLIDRNNHIISSLSKALDVTSEEIGKSSIQIESTFEKESLPDSCCPKSLERPSLSADNFETLDQKLFGQKNYKYSLQISSKLPSILYKERNFNLSVQLQDLAGATIRNYNLVSLCFAVCTCDGEWIHQNRAGEPFVKGKTEVELYKGEASFVKLYARDVSRSYMQGKVNLVVYAKPSTLIYSKSGSYETYVRPEEIKPLIIQDISIKAKKKD